MEPYGRGPDFQANERCRLVKQLDVLTDEGKHSKQSG